MASHFQAAPLVASPCYPNSIAWSEENLVAIASGHLVTILNPALLVGPRGLISVTPSTPLPIGVVKKEDLFTACLMPTCLSRDTRPCVRSISWSPPGVAPNSGCLLAVCTTEGRVKLYRQPFSEFRAEWVEVRDISEIMCEYFLSINFGEFSIPSNSSHEQMSRDYLIGIGCGSDIQDSILSKGTQQRQKKTSNRITENTGIAEEQLTFGRNRDFSGQDANNVCRMPSGKVITTSTEISLISCPIFKQDSLVEVLKEVGSQRVWISGTIKYMNATKALVLFTVDGEQDEWVKLNPESDEIKSSNFLDGIMTNQAPLLPNIRPSMNLGYLPKEIVLAVHHGVEEILRIQQAVEAWLGNRWVEGVFMGFNGHGLRVKLSGGSGCVTLDPSTVRLAPVWNGDLKSWQVTLVKVEVEDSEMCDVVEVKSENLTLNNPHRSFSKLGSDREPLKKGGDSPLVTAGQYASRSAMLSSLVVAWSPVFRLTSEHGPLSPNSSSNNGALLAVGGKSGNISFWRIHEPQCYTVEHDSVPVDAILIGLLQAHKGWITAISWGLYGADASNPHFLLATGSSDGSVKIWQGDADVLIKFSAVNGASFSLLKEVIPITSVPVSTLSLAVPVKSVGTILLAIGKGSGSLELWIYDVSSGEFQNAGCYDAHDRVVTGLAWAFDGCCLYSCSQDNSVRSWIFHGSGLYEVPFPSSSPNVKGSNDARSFDTDLLDPMYQARTQKAAVEFFWTAGQQLKVSSVGRYPGCNIEAIPGLSESDLALWESNILWSLEQYDNIGKPLILWDVIAALSAFMESAPKFVELILFKWLSNWLLRGHPDLSIEKIMFHAPRLLSKIDSRHMHLLNIICRRLMLAEVKADILSSKHHELGGVDEAENERLKLWIELLISSERELRERLVGFTFSVVLSRASCSDAILHPGTGWLPIGVAQMEQWLAVNHDPVQDQLKVLGSEVGDLRRRISTICEYVVEEKCNFCSASVPFVSPEVAFCEGAKVNGIVDQSHRLARCAVSMQVCPITPLWFCMCCLRWVSKLAPHSFFTMSKFPSDFRSIPLSSAFPKPSCPFCGILLQRLLPEFLLSASPV
ncbi:transducin/WD40 repeat-like superfamily protein isoform X2 [Tasmannia lanceolata]|uniref:transducin/WD40 repeat-like superfamily protein isoform X2 n=1 Tax=Tasmannia lanceolata TaxID=3420 RepID=UPI0040636D84